jgi:PPOX class probable F420-dependent enzyme
MFRNGLPEQLLGRKTILLTTYRRDGRPVGTPVSIAIERGRGFIRSYKESGKAKRIRNNPFVGVAPSTFRGKPLGSTVRMRAVLLNGEQAAIASRLIRNKHHILHGVLVPLLHRLSGHTTIYYELVQADT